MCHGYCKKICKVLHSIEKVRRMTTKINTRLLLYKAVCKTICLNFSSFKEAAMHK